MVSSMLTNWMTTWWTTMHGSTDVLITRLCWCKSKKVLRTFIRWFLSQTRSTCSVYHVYRVLCWTSTVKDCYLEPVIVLVNSGKHWCKRDMLQLRLRQNTTITSKFNLQPITCQLWKVNWFKTKLVCVIWWCKRWRLVMNWVSQLLSLGMCTISTLRMLSIVRFWSAHKVVLIRWTAIVCRICISVRRKNCWTTLLGWGKT